MESCHVFSILIANAVDAADGGAKKVYITAHRNDSYCEVSIRNFGNGFDIETLENIKAGQRSSTKPNGSGLGLQTVKILIERAEGQITIQSFENGALIRIRLPVLETPKLFYNISRTAGKRILAS